MPDGTKSLVLLMFDPEGRAPSGVSHWVAYGISRNLNGFAEGSTSKDSDQFVGGKSLMGVGYYSGPCTPPNQTPHHYTFTLIATDFAGELPPGLARDDVTAKFGAAAGAREERDRPDRIVCQSLARVTSRQYAAGSLADYRDIVERAGR